MEANFDDLLHSSRTIIQKLKGLRVDHNHLFQAPSAQFNRHPDGQSSEVSNVYRLLILGMEDASTTAQLIIQMQHYEAERQRTRMQVQRIGAENKWLRDELNRCRGRLIESEQNRMKLEVQIEHYKFCESSGLAESTSYDRHIDSSAPDSQYGNSTTTLRTESFDKSFGPTLPQASSLISTANTSTLGTSEFCSSDVNPKLRTLHNLVVHYASMRRYDVAVPLCRQTLEDLESTIGRNHPDVATMLNILALVYRDQNKYVEASHLLKEALSIREQCLGPNSPAVAATLNNLAVLQGRRCKYKEAEALCNRALAIRIKNLGADHTDVAKQLVNLGLICLNQNKFTDTFSHYERAIAIYRDRLGDDDTVVLRTQISMASAQIRAGRLADAELLLARTIIPRFCPSSENGDQKAYPDSHLILSAARTCLNLLKEQNRDEDVATIDAIMTAGSGKMNQLLDCLRNLFVKAAGSSAGKTSRNLRHSTSGCPSQSLSFAKLRATIRICSSSLLTQTGDNSRSELF